MTITSDITSAEFKVQGVIGISNTGGIEVMFNRSNDGVYYRFNHGQDNLADESIFEAELVPAPIEDGEEDSSMGFNHGEVFYNLNECIRVS